MKNSKDNFSVALGLFDYINPICYAVTTFTLYTNLKTNMSTPFLIIFVLGAILSMIFGLTIPTVKFIVGLGIMEFKMPVNLVFYVNTGILLSGISLFSYIFKLELIWIAFILIAAISALIFIFIKTRKFNTVAVLTGAIGYILIYSSLINLAIVGTVSSSIVMYAVAILFFVGLCAIGIKANLKDARVHWVIETCNVLCQLSVAIATVLLFK